MLSPEQRDDDPKVPKVPRLPGELRCQVIVPQAPTSELFPLMTAPAARPIPGVVRLVGPSLKKPPLRLRSIYTDSLKTLTPLPSTSSERHIDTLASPGLSDHGSELDSDQLSQNSSSPESRMLSTLLKCEERLLNQVRDTQRKTWLSEQFGRPATAVPGELVERLSREVGSSVSSPPKLPRRFGYRKAVPPAANPISSVSLSQSQHAVVYPVNGTLASLSIAAMLPTQRLADISLPNDLHMARASSISEDGFVTHVRTADAFGSDPARVVAATSDTVSFGTISDSHCLSFHNVHSATALDIAISAHVDEVAILTPFAVRTMPSVRLSDAVHHDVQPLDPREAFCSVAYSTHPRVLLLASQFSLSTMDLRIPDAASASRFLRVSDWRLPAYDRTFTAFTASRSSFQAVLATKSLVAYFDIRAPTQPLLRLPYSHATPVSRLAVLHCPDKNRTDAICDVIAYANPACKSLSVAQILSNPFSNDSAPEPTSALQHPPFVWGGEPFHVGDALPSMQLGDCPGLAFLSSLDTHRKHIVSWSASTGLTAIPFYLRPTSAFGDDESVDSSEDEEETYGAAPSSPLAVSATLDSSLHATRDRQRLIASGALSPTPADIKPVSGSVGARLHECTRKMPARLALQIRSCICSESADTIVNGLRIPHPSANGVSLRLDDHAVSVCSNPSAQKLKNIPPFLLDDVAKLDYNGQPSVHGCDRMVHAMEALDKSRVLRGEAVTWHEGCSQRAHHPDYPECVSTEHDLPDWINKLVYFNADREGVENIKNEANDVKYDDDLDLEFVAPQSSEYGQMMQRVWRLFFDDSEGKIE